MAHDDLFDLKAERDEWHDNAPKDGSSKNKRRNRDSSSGDSSGTVIIIVTLILAVLLGALGYWVSEQFNQVYGQFDRVNQQFDLLSKRVKVLESKLDVSNDNMLNSDAAVKATLKEHGSEIRKLWGISYDRNKKSIKANQDALKSLKKTAKQLQAESKAYSGKFKATEQKLSSLGGQLGDIDFKATMAKLSSSQKASETKLNALSEKVEPIGSLLEKQAVEVKLQAKKVNELNDELLRSITDLQIQLNDESLKKKVNKLSGLIDSIDKNRSRVNSELVKLSNRVNELQKASVSP